MERGEAVTALIESNCHILVVDDNRIELKMLLKLLESPEFEVSVASSGEEALDLLREIQPSFILCEVMLHGISGFDFCRAIRQDCQHQDIPIFLMSQSDNRETRVKAFEAGADGQIGKPFNPVEVRAIVKNLTRLNRMQRIEEQKQEVARAYETLQSTYDETIQGWVRALDLRDNETENHSQRVAAWTVELAQFVGIEEDQITHIWRGALLHDVGKIGVPDAILHKAGKLTDEERAFMQRHPELAYELLSPIDYLRPAMEIPYCHHEKWDGTGYPLGLSGEDIPLAARLFSVVDVYDALRSDRPYKQGWSEEEALAEIKRMAGTHFDPRVVHAWVELRKSQSLQRAA